MRALVTGCGRRLGILPVRTAGGRGLAGDGQLSQRASPSWPACGHLGVELVQADFAVEGEVARLVTVLGAHDDLALIIHNASAFEPQAAEPAAQLAQFEQFYRVHMAAPFQLNRALAPQLAGNPNASIIHITDIYIHAPAPQFAAYVATKAGAHSLAMSFAGSWHPRCGSTP